MRFRPSSVLLAVALTVGAGATPALSAPGEVRARPRAHSAVPPPRPALVQDPTPYADLLIGTRNGGNVFPGAVVPFGMLSWSPENTRGDATRSGGAKSELDNEPSINVPYLYAYAGVPFKTQETARAAMGKLWSTQPAGIPGNDDLGAMSSWYVFSAVPRCRRGPNSSWAHRCSRGALPRRDPRGRRGDSCRGHGHCTCSPSR